MTDVPEHPALAPWYRVAGDEDRLVFEHAHRAVVLEGAAVRALLPRLLPLLDGTRTVPDLAAALELPPEPVEHALRVLSGRGLLLDGPRADVEPGLREVAEQVAAACARSPQAVANALARCRVAVAGESGAAAEAMRLLAAAGLDPVRVVLGDPPAADLLIAAPANDELAGLEQVDEAAQRDGFAWLQMLPFDGRIAAVGPLVLPGETACGRCYALRRGASLGFADVERALATEPPRAAGGAVIEALAAAAAVALAVRWLGARDPRVPGVLHAVEAQVELGLSRHPVLRVPRCPVCSQSARRARPAPWFDPVPAEAA